ncbi:MAG: glycosyltransferase family 2 protein [Clostridia bacterium]|nr:glycosyltransferase family 2 protein [Clostridia bacterium]
MSYQKDSVHDSASSSKVSVIIPTHNRSWLLINAISSVMKQTHKNLEIIIIDDHSTDETAEIVTSIDDPRVIYVKNQKKGGNAARNTGISLSTGDFVAFLDDDDEWVEDKIEKQLKVFGMDSRVGLVYTGSKLIYLDFGVSYDNIPFAGGDLSKIILMRNPIGSTSSVMIKRNIFKRAGLFDESLPALQDYDLWIRICQACQIGFVKEPLLYYYMRSDANQISVSMEKRDISISRINEKYIHLFERLTKKQLVERKAAGLLRNAFKAKLNGDSTLARKYIMKSIFIKPKIKSVLQYILTFLHMRTQLKVRAKLAGSKCRF